MTKLIRLAAFVSFLVFVAVFRLYAAETGDILQRVERLCERGEEADPSLGESIADEIAKNPAQLSKVLVQKLKDKTLTEQQQAVYVWALGLTKDPAAVSDIIELHKFSKSSLVQGNCLRALAVIGGKPSCLFLMSVLDATTDKEMRFNILNLLGQMQFDVALQQADEILSQDKEFYWQSIFFFGKMGDKAVDYLLKKVNDKDSNVRGNALNVLGQWLISPEAAKPLQDRFWVEQDADLRYVILCSLERTMPDLIQMKAFFEQVVGKEKDEKLGKFAKETLESMDKMKATVATYKRKKKPSASSFRHEYSQLFKSAGKKGVIDALGMFSTIEDEPQLKALRERILQRDSDEAFYDYQKVNEIILKNRMIRAMDENVRGQSRP